MTRPQFGTIRLRPIAERIVEPGKHFLHAKTGRVYRVVMLATIEATMKDAVVYVRADDLSAHPRHWIRPLAEFCDGRFRHVELSETDA